MQVQIGAFSCLANGVVWTTSINPYVVDHVVVSRSFVVNLEGQLEGSSQQDCAAKSDQFQAAIHLPNQDIILRDDNGVIVQALRNSNSQTGVLCVSGPNFPMGTGAEFATYRTFNCTFVADYLATWHATDSELLADTDD